MRHNSLSDDVLSGSADAGTLDLGAAASSVWQRKRWIILPTLAALIVSAAVVEVIRPTYKATSQVLLQSQESSFTRPGGDQPNQSADAVIDDSAVGSQVQALLSRDLARQAIARLDLGNNPDFDLAAHEPGLVERLMRQVGLAKSVSGKGHDERVLDAYVDALSVYPLEKSRVIAIEFSARDPDLAARAANTIASLFIETEQAAKRRTSQVAADSLSPQLADLRQRVARADAAVESYRAKTGLFMAQNSSSLSQQQLADVSTQLSNARAQQAEAQARAKMIRSLVSSNRPVELSDVTNNELVRRLVEQRVQLQAQLAQEQRTLLPQHPRIKGLKAQLAGLEEQIITEGLRTARSMENDAQIAGSRVEQLQQDLEHQKTASADSNEQSVKLRALELEAKADRDLLESTLTRYSEASARASLADLPADARVVSRAVPPTMPYFPKKGPLITIATLLVFVLSTALVAMIQLLAAPAGRQRVTVVPERAVEPALWADAPKPASAPASAPAAAVMPQAEAASVPAPLAAAAIALPEHPVLDAVAARLRASGEAGHCILIDGLDTAGQASRAAAQLARALAGRQMSAVVIDLDGEAGSPGFGELLAGEATFTDVIERRTGVAAHSMATGTLPVLEPAVAAERTAFVIDALASSYDVAIVAAGPHHRAALQPCLNAIAGDCDEALIVAGPGQDEAVADRRTGLIEAGAPLITAIDPEPAVERRAAA